MNDLVAQVLSSVGPEYAGWVIAAWLFYRLVKINENGHSVIDRNTEALTAFRTVLDERLPRGGVK